MNLSLDDIQSLFEKHGASLYGGEAVTQLEHALQTAALAESEGAPHYLIAAALLHDLGHIIQVQQQESAELDQETDHRHQVFVLPFLQESLPAAVLEPIRMHVDAKRCLCAIDETYFSTLSPASVHSLELQGGIFSEDQVETFMQQPYAVDAIRLRRWDDLAKVPGQPTPDLTHFLTIVANIQEIHALEKQ